MSDHQTTAVEPAPNICYGTHVAARSTGFVTADRWPRAENEEGHEALDESLMTYARERGVEFASDSDA